MGDQGACARANVNDTAGEAQRRPFTRLEITVGVPLRYISAVQIRCRGHDAAQPLHARTSLPCKWGVEMPQHSRTTVSQTAFVTQQIQSMPSLQAA